MLQSKNLDKKYRVVLDSNVYISLFISQKGSLETILSAALERRFITLTSPVIIREVARILENKFVVELADIKRYLKFIVRLAEIVTPQSIERVIPNDPDDDHIVACAVEGEADLIVTGNTKHFRKIKRHKDVVFVTPTEFIRMIEGL